jgi:predicted nuclease of restriction endonuclease-like RecB superfamily
MRLALAEVRKRIVRREGRTLVSPYLLRPGELTAELDALIQLYEAFLGHPYHTFPEDRSPALIGDYRLARCLTTCLTEWYEWRSPEWPKDASPPEQAALASAGLASPGDLRLALYDHVNATEGGYLAATGREAALNSFAAGIGISRATLDALLWMDERKAAVLGRTSAEHPHAGELARRYNQRAVETLLSHASQIEWIVPATVADGTGGGLGTVVKRCCFLARRMGVHYDVAFVNTAASMSGPAVREDGGAPQDLGDSGRAVSLVLYGPPEVMAAPGQYGERLARLARALLGYRRAVGTGLAALGGEGLRGHAEIYLYGRAVLFPLDERLLKLIHMHERRDDATPPETQFDSSLERDLHADFAALTVAGESHGWLLSREPEPVLVADTILVPDFALTRGSRRVYMEVAGYWRPGYRERKARKLQALGGRVAMIVAAPESARAEFTSLGDTLPFLWYTHHPRAQAVLDLLEQSFNDLPERLALLDSSRIQQEVQRRGYVPVRETMALFGVYTRNELATALASVDGDLRAHGWGSIRQGLEKWAEVSMEHETGLIWLAGIGLLSTFWLVTLLEKIRDWVTAAPAQALPLLTVRELILADRPILIELADSEVERLTQMAGCRVHRSSMFDAQILGPGAELVLAEPEVPPARMLRTQPRRTVRRKESRAHNEAPSLFPIQPSKGDP